MLLSYRTDAEEEPPLDQSPLEVSVSCDGTWQRRGHQSLYGMQAAISVDTRKVLDYEIQSKSCTEYHLHGNWDHTSEAYKKWYEQHQSTCHINYWSTSNSMEAFGSKKMWCRSLKKRNLMYTTYVGDGDSAAQGNCRG